MDFLDEFDLAWKNGTPPDWKLFAVQTGILADHDAVCELIRIDMEARWRSAAPNVQRYGTEHYLPDAGVSLNQSRISQLICWEYEVRNRWGDCPNVPALVEKWPTVDGLKAELLRTGKEIPWPITEISDAGSGLTQLCRIALDRPAEVGRQMPMEPNPPAAISFGDQYRIIAAHGQASGLSRRQLRIELATPNAVRIRNLSSHRCIVVAREILIQPAECRTASLPLEISLPGTFNLRIHRSDSR